MAWPDQRLDSLEARVDAGFERVNTDIRELRAELKGDIAKLDAKVDRQQLLLIQLFVGFFFALIGADAVGLIGS